MIYTDLLKNIWNAVYDPKSDTAKIIEEFFHPDYEQCINGVKMKRAEYIPHVIAQKNNMMVDVIEYHHVLEKENELFAIYYPKGKNTDGLPIEAEVMAYFLFENQKVLKIHGQVRLIQGSTSDVDM